MTGGPRDGGRRDRDKERDRDRGRDHDRPRAANETDDGDLRHAVEGVAAPGRTRRAAGHAVKSRLWRNACRIAGRVFCRRNTFPPLILFTAHVGSVRCPVLQGWSAVRLPGCR